MKFTGICTQKDLFTGSTTQKDFLTNGNCHILQFYKNEKFISVSVAGFSASYFYTFNPNEKQKKINDYFMNRYVMQCNNSSEILPFFN